MSGNTHESSKDSESRIVSESLVIMFIFLVMIIGGFVRLISKKLHVDKKLNLYLHSFYFFCRFHSHRPYSSLGLFSLSSRIISEEYLKNQYSR